MLFVVSCGDVRYDFCTQKNDVGWSLPQLFVKVLLSNLCYLRLFAHSDVNYDLSI